MSFAKGFAISPLTASAIQNFEQDVLAIIYDIGGMANDYAHTGSTNIFKASQIISGNLDVDGVITGKEFHVTYVTSSVLYTSGSTKFGDSFDDTHEFSGSVYISSSLRARDASLDYIDLNTNNINPTFKTGRLHYGATSGDIEFDTDVTNLVLKIGQQTILKVHNSLAQPLAKGKLVKFTGANNATPPFVTTASWINEAESAHTIGMVMEQIPANTDGYIILEGVLTGLNLNTGIYTPGDLLFLSSSGDFINSPPPAGSTYHGVRIGQILKTGGGGAVFISVDNGYEIRELHDADINNPQHGDLFMRSGTVEGQAQWINTKDLKGNYTITGSLAVGDSSNSSGAGSLTVGLDNTTNGSFSFAQGWNSRASGGLSFAQGYRAVSNGDYSHAQGAFTNAFGIGSHAEGAATVASGSYSHAAGNNTIAYRDYQSAIGEYNTGLNNDDLLVVGNGTSLLRKNAFGVSMTSSYFNVPLTASAISASLYKGLPPISNNVYYGELTSAFTASLGVEKTLQDWTSVLSSSMETVVVGSNTPQIKTNASGLYQINITGVARVTGGTAATYYLIFRIKDTSGTTHRTFYIGDSQVSAMGTDESFQINYSGLINWNSANNLLLTCESVGNAGSSLNITWSPSATRPGSPLGITLIRTDRNI